MLLDLHASERIAAELRSAAAGMAAVVDDLALGGSWSGPDAAEFRSRWTVVVTEPLRVLADSLDGLLVELVRGLPEVLCG